MKKQIYLFVIFAIFHSCQKETNTSKKAEISVKIQKNSRYFDYSLNSPTNVIIIFNDGNDTLITDKGLFPIKSEMDENRAYIYHLKYKGREIGNYFEEFENISKNSICLDSSFVTKEECFDLINISEDSLKKIELPIAKKKFLEKYKIIR